MILLIRFYKSLLIKKKMSTDLTKQEKYKLRQLEFKEANKKSLCWVNFFSTVATVALLVGTLVILNTETNACSDSHLRLTMWLMIGMHATNIIEAVCGLTGLDHIFCPCCCVLAFFIYEVAVLIYMQSIFFTSSHCDSPAETPKQYWWLLVNIIVYFFFVLLACYFHLRSLFGGPSKEEIEEEDRKKGEQLKASNNLH